MALCHSPGWSSPKSHSPTLILIRRSVGNPTAAVIRRTCRFLPSLIVSLIQLVGIDLRTRIGGWRSQRAPGSVATARAGLVIPSRNSTPLLN